MIRLVVNADDLGLAPEIDDGIFEAAQAGIVTSASVLVMGRSFESARRRLSGVGLGVGVHLAAVGGLPPAAGAERLPGLCDDGRLPRAWPRLIGKLLLRPRIAREVIAEFEAQLSRARDSGLAIDHVDAHQHLHVWPALLGAVLDLCRRFGVRRLRLPDEPPSPAAIARPIRLAAMIPLAGLGAWSRRRAEHFIAPRFWGLYDGGSLDRPALLRLIEGLSDGDHEIGCHPGRGVQGVPEDPEWRYRWDAERVALCDPQVRSVIDLRGIRLCRFGDL